VAVVGDEEKGSGRWPRFSGPQGIAHNGLAVCLVPLSTVFVVNCYLLCFIVFVLLAV